MTLAGGADAEETAGYRQNPDSNGYCDFAYCQHGGSPGKEMQMLDQSGMIFWN